VGEASSVWHDASVPVLVSVALAGAIALTGLAGSLPLALAVGLAQATLIATWHRALDVPGFLGGAVLCGLTALAVDLLLLREEARPLAPVTGVLALAMVGVLLHQLVRRHRDRVTASMTGTATLAVLTALTAMYVAALGTRGAGALVALVVLAVAAACVAGAAPVPPAVRGLLALAVGAAVGVAIGAGTTPGPGAGLLLGLAAGATAALGTALVRHAARAEWLVAGALPVALGGPVAYVLGRIVVG
jgi:hypothetical protein